MKQALVAGGLVVVAALTTTLTTGLAAAAGPNERPARQIMNSGLCVANGVFDRAADPGLGRGPAVQALSENGPDRAAQGSFGWSVACVGQQAAF